MPQDKAAVVKRNCPKQRSARAFGSDVPAAAQTLSQIRRAGADVG